MRTLLVAIPGLLLAGIGLTHPHYLDASTAGWWRDMHIILALIFPLLGAAQWVLLAEAPAAMRWIGRLAAFGYAVFYGALDALAGIGGGAMAAAQGGRTPVIDPLFEIGNDLGRVGAWCFFVASALVIASVALRARWWAVPGGLVLLVGSYLFLDSHIYWPKGVLAMVCFAAGFALLSAARQATPRSS